MELNNPILIEGLPGIGNVGKIAVDFLIDELDAKKLFTYYSYSFPNSVFINEKNLVDLPSISLYLVKRKKNDLLLLAGDIQPTDEYACYKFTEIMLNMLAEYGGKEIITTGGIGLSEIPEEPRVYCTANKRKIITAYKKYGKIHDKIYGIVGPIIGVTGLLVGMADRWKMDAISLLSETFGHPMYLGIKGARQILKILIKRFKLKINLKELDKEIKKIEKEMLKRKEELENVSQQSAMNKYQKQIGEDKTTYIG